MGKIIQRSKEGAVLELLTHFPVVALTGARQAGKTTLAKRIAANKKRKHYNLILNLPGMRASSPIPSFFSNGLMTT